MTKLDLARKKFNYHYPLNFRFICFKGLIITRKEFYNTEEK